MYVCIFGLSERLEGWFGNHLQRDGLSSDLNLYLPGLAPILSFASLSVKPNVLTLFETYLPYLKPSSLRPALKSLILTLLPGLEEENSDEFDWTLRILEALKSATSSEERPSDKLGSSPRDQYFWQCLFLASITSPSKRPGALAYLTRNLPPLGPPSAPGGGTSLSLSSNVTESTEESKLRQAVDAVASPEPGLLIRCFCSGLGDEQSLIQRGFLDLLVTNLPLNSIVLQDAKVSADLQRLVTAATSVVARRDMSLNRRLWSWFLGPEPTAEAPNGSTASPTSVRSSDGLSPTHGIMAFQTPFFERFGLKPLNDSIRAMIRNEPDGAAERMRPLRICLSLMDRWEIGGLVVPQIFLPAMQSVWRYQKTSPSRESYNEVLKSANMFFDGIESGLIWAELTKLVAQALSTPQQQSMEPRDMLDLVLFVTNNFNIREEDMQIVHMPLITLFIVLRVRNWLAATDRKSNVAHDVPLQLSLEIANNLLELIPSRALTDDDATNGSTNLDNKAIPPSEAVFLSQVESFYSKKLGNVDQGKPFSSKAIGMMLLRNSFELVSDMVKCVRPSSYKEIDYAISILGMVIRKGPRVTLDLESFLSTLLSRSAPVSEKLETFGLSFPLTAAKVSVLEIIFSSSHATSWVPDHSVRRFIPSLLAEVWPALSPSLPKYNVEAARCIWRIHSTCVDQQLVESTIVSLLTSVGLNDKDSLLHIENARRFTILWTQTPLTPTTSQSRRSSLVHRKQAMMVPNSSLESGLSFLERPLMLLLDSLSDPTTRTFSFVVNWLQSLANISP